MTVAELVEKLRSFRPSDQGGPYTAASLACSMALRASNLLAVSAKPCPRESYFSCPLYRRRAWF